MSAESQAKTSRQCDAALTHIQGVCDDLGVGEAMALYRAQVAAAMVMLSNSVGVEAAALIMTKTSMDIITEILIPS